MQLLFINSLNQNFKGENIYEFIFGDTLDIEYGEDWDVNPASTGNITPPPIEGIDKVYVLKTDELLLDLIQHSEHFGVMDAVDRIIALGWEYEFNEDLDSRLVFHFGDNESEVIEKLNQRGLGLTIIEENKIYKEEII